MYKYKHIIYTYTHTPFIHHAGWGTKKQKYLKILITHGRVAKEAGGQEERERMTERAGGGE